MTKEIEIFDNGFSVFGRFFNFNEIEKVDLSYIPTRSGGYMEFVIYLKDKTISYRIDKDYKNAMFLQLKTNKENCKKSEINLLMLILSVMVLIFIMGNELRMIGIIMGFFVVMYWHNKFRIDYLYKLCMEVKKEYNL